MANNLVHVTAQFTDGTHAGEGNYQFIATGSLAESDTVALVSPVIMGSLDSAGSLAVDLLASDDFFAGQLTWHVIVRVRGMPEIDVSDVVVNFVDGATQGLFGILEANGWTGLAI